MATGDKIYVASKNDLDNHVTDTDNPHNVTLAQVLGGDVSGGTIPIANGGTGATTASGALSNLGGVPTTRTVNSKALSSNITLTASDVGARASDWMPSASDVGAAASTHTHGAGDITSGTLAVARGGTGQTTLQATRNAMGLGNTTGALPIANGGTGQTTAAAARNALGLGNTTGAVPIANGGTGQTTLDLAVGTAGARAIYAGTSDMTAGTSSLTTGRIYLVYE